MRSTHPSFRVKVGIDVGVSGEMNGVSVARIVSVGSAGVGVGVGGPGVAVGISISTSTGVAVEWTFPQAVEYNIKAVTTRLTFFLLYELMQLV